MIKKIIVNTFINGFDLIITSTVSLFLIPIILSRLGSEIFGIYSILAMFSVTGFFAFLDFGFEGALIKHLSFALSRKDFRLYQSYYYNGLFLYFIFGLFSFIILYFINNYFLQVIFNINPSNILFSKDLLNIYLFQLPFQFISLGISSAYKSSFRFFTLKIINATYVSLNALIFIFLVYDRNKLLNFIIFQNWLFIIRVAIELILSLRNIPNRSFRYLRVSISAIKEIFSYGKILFTSKIIGFIYNQTDKVLISVFLPVKFLGYYSIISKLPELLRAVLSIINSTFVSAAANYAKQFFRLKELFIRGTRYTILTMYPIVSIVIFLTSIFFKIWVGEEYMHLEPICVVFILTVFMTSITSIGSTMAVGSGHVGELIPISIYGSIVNIIVSILLIKQLNILGLVLGTNISYILITYPYVKKLSVIYKVKKNELTIMILHPILLNSILFGSFYSAIKLLELNKGIIILFIILGYIFSLSILIYKTILSKNEINIMYSFMLRKKISVD